MAAANKLTVQGLRSLKEPGRYSDGAGLYFMIDPSGRTSRWVFRFTLNGRTTEMGLGGYPAISLADAREKAAEIRKTVKAGVDPVAEKRVARAEARADRERAAIPTFGQCADDYIRRHAAGWKNPKHADQWRMSLTKLAAPIRDLRVDEVDKGAIIKLLDPIWDRTPETASRLRGRIEIVLDDARVRGHISEDKANPARWHGNLKISFGKRPKNVEHHAALPYAQAPEFMVKLKSQTSVSAMALEFMILTAARTGEIVGARWDEINFETAVWTVPAERMKPGKPHRVPLSAPAIDVLRKLEKVRTNDFVFPGQTEGTPISNAAMMAVLRRIAMAEAKARGEETHIRVAASGRKSTKLKRLYFKPDVTVHGFRSTFRDWAGEETDFPREVCEAALSHAIGDETEEAYRRGDALKKRRQLMDAWAKYLF